MTMPVEEELNGLEKEQLKLQNEMTRVCGMLKFELDDDDVNCLENVMKTLKELYRSDATKLVALTNETHEIAGKMSANLRQRDLERDRLQRVLYLLSELDSLNQNLQDLKSSIDDGELGDQCSLFHSINSCPPMVRDAWNCRHCDGESSTLDMILHELQSKLLKRLAGLLEANNSKLSDNIDEVMGSAFKMLSFFALIDQREVGLRGLSSLIQRFTSHSLGSIVNQQSSLDFRFAMKTGKVCEFVKGLSTWCRQQLRRTDYGDEAIFIIVSKIHTEAESSMVSIIRSFTSERRLHQTIDMIQEGGGGGMTTFEGGGQNGIRGLDLLVTEIALILQNGLSFAYECQITMTKLSDHDKMKLSNLGSLFDMIGELLANYSLLERNYLSAGTKMALSMNEIEEGEKTFTCVEDVFFLCKKCCTRAVAIGEFTIIMDLIEMTLNLLQSDLLPLLQKRSRQLVPDPKSKDHIMIAINDAITARSFLERLVDEMRSLVEDSNSLLYSIDRIRAADGLIVKLETLQKSKILNSLNGLDTVADSVGLLIRTGLDSIYSTLLRSKLSPILIQLSKDLQNFTDPSLESPLPRLIPFIDKTLLPILSNLLDENSVALLLMIATDIALNLERTLLGGGSWITTNITLFERDHRRLVSYLAGLTELQAKSLFTRTSQMLTILTCGNREEAINIVKDSQGEYWKLTDSEVETLLNNRTDW